MQAGPTTSPSLLVTMLDSKDNDAWRRFFRAYSPMFLAITKKYSFSDADSDDIISETVRAVHKRFSDPENQFDISRGNFRGWLRTVLKNKMIDAWRARARDKTIPLHENHYDQKIANEFDFLFDLEWKRNISVRAMAEAKRNLPPTTYQSFILYAIQGQSAKKVAKLLSIAPATVFVNKRRALAMIRNIVDRLVREEG